MNIIDITRWWLAATPAVLRGISGSQAEHGPLAGQITWANAVASAELIDPLTPEQAYDLRTYFADYGAWDREEIDAWPEPYLRAMLAQEVASSARLWDLSCLTTKADWPTMDEDGFLARADWRLINDREGPPRFDATWNEADGSLARVFTNFF